MDSMTWWLPTITPVANAYQFDPRLVMAVVWTESRGRADAFRHEPKFWLRYMADNPKYKGRGLNPRRVSSSYGLMQVMYVVAEEQGFKGEPEELFLPVTNLHFGCQVLRDRREWAATFAVPEEKRVLSMLASYNGGKGGNAPTGDLRPENRAYADRVLAAYRQLQGT